MSTGAGVHWFVVYRRGEEIYEIFDSLGTTADFVRKVLRRKGHCEFNESALQSTKSDNCGEFCVYYIVERFFNYDLSYAELLLSAFHGNPEKNEEEVSNFLEILLESKYGT